MILRHMLLTLLCGVSLCLRAEDAKMNLVVLTNDDTRVAYLINDDTKLTFTDNDLVIKYNGVDIVYAIDDMKGLAYEDAHSTDGVNGVGAHSTIDYDGNALSVRALDKACTVSLYSMGGELLMRRNVSLGQCIEIPMHDFQRGVYLISINGQTQKLIKK